MERMLLHSAMQTGAAQDDEIITGLAIAMIPQLERKMPLDALDAVYTRWLDVALSTSDTRAQMVTAHDLLSTWAQIQSELAAQAAREHEYKARSYRAEVERQLREAGKQVRPAGPVLRDLEAQVGRPISPAQRGMSEAEKASTAPNRWDRYYPADDLIAPNVEAVVSAEQHAKEQRNREEWFKLIAEKEREAANRPVNSTETEGK